jgi:CheY-like chemotaxis protein
MILIADDNDDVRRMLRSIVEDIDPDIIECVNGLEAFEAYAEHGPDVVLMDIGMEPVDGLTAMKMILGSFPEARIIVVTEHRDPRTREISLDKGASAFVGKDDVTALAEIVRDLATKN